MSDQMEMEEDFGDKVLYDWWFWEMNMLMIKEQLRKVRATRWSNRQQVHPPFYQVPVKSKDKHVAQWSLCCHII